MVLIKNWTQWAIALSRQISLAHCNQIINVRKNNNNKKWSNRLHRCFTLIKHMSNLSPIKLMTLKKAIEKKWKIKNKSNRGIRSQSTTTIFQALQKTMTKFLTKKLKMKIGRRYFILNKKVAHNNRRVSSIIRISQIRVICNRLNLDTISEKINNKLTE